MVDLKQPCLFSNLFLWPSSTGYAVLENWIGTDLHGGGIYVMAKSPIQIELLLVDIVVQKLRYTIPIQLFSVVFTRASQFPPIR